MTRTKMVDGRRVALTPAEEAARDAEEAAWAAGAGPRAAAALRARRDELLRASDWTQIGDAALSAARKAEWKTYRQALRDLPAATPDPARPAWPQPPA